MGIAQEHANKKPIGPHGKISGFRCAYRTSMSEFDEGGLYLAEYEGDLFVFLDDNREEGLDDGEQVAGQARLFVLNADAAESEGENLFDLLDRRAETAAYIPLLGDEIGNFSPAVCKILGEDMALCRNMLILDRLEILPQYRGQQLGLKYMRAAITRFGIGCRLVAIKPFPLQFEGKLESAEAGAIGAEIQFSPPSKSVLTELRAATAKLKKYYTREGFVSLRGSDLMILDLEKQR
jgi:GNAT superfamily N-acetyltransferase